MYTSKYIGTAARASWMLSYITTINTVHAEIVSKDTSGMKGTTQCINFITPQFSTIKCL